MTFPVKFSRRLALQITAAFFLGNSTLPVRAQQALDFDTVMAKEGGYAGIVKEFLGTSDPKIIAFVKREGDRYISQFSLPERHKEIEIYHGYLAGILARAKGDRTPSQGSVDFFMKNSPQLLIDFIPYERDYPNLASKGKLFLADQNLQRADQNLQRAHDLNRRLTGQKP